MASCEVLPKEDQLPVSEYRPPIFMVVICGLSSFLQAVKNKSESNKMRIVNCFMVVIFLAKILKMKKN
jgi:hypothetical protein